MYNLIVRSGGWSGNRDRMPADRMFEHTEATIIERFRPSGHTDFDSLLTLPTLFVEESSLRPADQVVRLGSITRVRMSARDVMLDYVYDPMVAGFTNQALKEIVDELEIVDWEFSRTHWAVKDVDLCRVLLRKVQPRRRQPRIFTIADPERLEPTLVAVMMPFHPAFDRVYATLQQAAEAAGLRCRRADDIWESPAIIQDVVSLIDRSLVIICDCTGRNPNVFYETGIAHALGREVILITQAEADIPFDLRHLRFVPYLNNGEGLEALRARLAARLSDLNRSIQD